MQARACRPGRDVERFGNLGWCVARVVIEHEDCPLFGRQPPESALELVSIGDSEEVVGRGWSVDRQDPKIADTTTLARRLADADADDETVEPRIEPIRIAESSHVTPGDHQRVLQGILGSVDVAQNPVGKPEQPIAARADQVDICLPISTLGCGHEVSIHPASSLTAPVGDALPIMMVARRSRAFNLHRRFALASRARSPWLSSLDGTGDFGTTWISDTRARDTSRRTVAWYAWRACVGELTAISSTGVSWGGQMDLYGWVVVAHVAAVILSLGAHGASAFAMFRVRRETDRTRMAAVLEVSSSSLAAAGIGLVLAIVLGIVAAIMGGHFSNFWPWAAIIVLVIVIGSMTPLAAKPMGNLRRALGMTVQGDRKGDLPRTSGTDEEVAAARARIRPELPAGIGVAGVVVLTWLMEARPF